MVIWNILDESSGASQPACQMCPYGAAQPLEAYVAQCVGIKVLNFNMPMPQLLPNRERVFNVFEKRRRWNRLHVAGARTRARKMRDMLAKLGHPSANDFVLCSEVAGCKGFRASVLDFRHFVQEGLPETSYFTDGAYLNLWNVPINIAAEVQAGTWKASTGQPSYMHWQAFDLTYEAPQFAARDAPQLAAPKVGLLVGNFDISAEHCLAKQRILQQALQHLTSLEVDAWRNRKDFNIMRLLVGDCKLSKEAANAVTLKVRLPPLTALQRDFNFGRWEVCDVDFPRQVLESAPRQKLPSKLAKACCGRKHAASVRIPRPLWEPGNTKPGAVHASAALRTHDVHLRGLREGAPRPCWGLLPRPRIARRPARRRDNAADDPDRPNPPLDPACRRRSSSACRRAVRRGIGLGSGHPGTGRLWGSTLRCVYRKASGARAREASQHLFLKIHFFI